MSEKIIIAVVIATWAFSFAVYWHQQLKRRAFLMIKPLLLSPEFYNLIEANLKTMREKLKKSEQVKTEDQFITLTLPIKDALERFEHDRKALSTISEFTTTRHKTPAAVFVFGEVDGIEGYRDMVSYQQADKIQNPKTPPSYFLIQK